MESKRNISEVKTLIRIGFEKPSYFKRSVWVKVERIMTFLQHRGEVYGNNGECKFIPRNGNYTEHDLERWANMWLDSPFEDHLDELHRLSAETGLPLNDKRLLNKYYNCKN